LLDRLQHRRLDQVDHDRRGEHGDAAGADERRGVLGRDDELGGAGEAGGDVGEGGHDGEYSRKGGPATKRAVVDLALASNN
jgi:hypothetical protein